MSKPHKPGRKHDRNRANLGPKTRQRTKRKPESGKGKSRQSARRRRKNMLDVACTRCNYRVQMNRLVFGRESHHAAGCRCPFCGGNLVVAKYTEAHGAPQLGSVQLDFGRFKGSRLSDVPRNYLERLVQQIPRNDQFEEFQQIVKEFLTQA
jgi:hypothetical protein